MPPYPSSASDQHARPSPEHLSEQTVLDLLVPLTVITAQAQMLGRWARRSDAPDTDAMLAKLALIDAAVSRVVEVLDSRRQTTPSRTSLDDAVDGS